MGQSGTMKIQRMPPTGPLPPMVTFADCEKGETAAKTGCAPKGAGGGGKKEGDAGGGERIPKPSEGFVLPNAAKKLGTRTRAEVASGLARIEKKSEDYAAGKGNWTSLSPGEFAKQIEWDRDEIAVKERVVDLLQDVDSLPASLDLHVPGSPSWASQLEKIAEENAPPDEKKRRDAREAKERRQEEQMVRREYRGEK